MTLIIAVDGTAGSGKGTLCRSLARRHEWLPLESGLFYRSLARAALSRHLDEVLASHGFGDLEDEELRSESIAMAASQLAQKPEVRVCVNNVLRTLAAHLPAIYKGMIVDGRDIGTVVFPDATVKFYLTADAATRQERRNQERSTEEIGNVSERDQQDMMRKEAPLTLAEDAYVLDTTHMTMDEVRIEAEKWIAQCLKNKTL